VQKSPFGKGAIGSNRAFGGARVGSPLRSIPPTTNPRVSVPLLNAPLGPRMDVDPEERGATPLGDSEMTADAFWLLSALLAAPDAKNESSNSRDARHAR
jgi:hypothetical protein